MCYHVKGVCITRRELPKIGNAGAPTPCGGAVADPLDTPSITCIILPNMVVLG